MPSASEFSLGQLLAQGGLAMLPIYACSVLALTVFVYKLLAMRAARLGDLSCVKATVDAVAAGDHDAATRVAKGAVHPSGEVLSAVVRTLEAAPQRAEAEGRRVGSLVLQRQERLLPLLAFVAQVAPLLGLLGTVVGMVELFMGMQGAGNVDVSALASGIWKALITTAAGLAVAVPALAAHGFLASRVDRLRLNIADAIQQVITVSMVPGALGHEPAAQEGATSTGAAAAAEAG